MSQSMCQTARESQKPSRIACIGGVVFLIAMTFHWIPAYWAFYIRPVFSRAGQPWDYHLSVVLLGVVLTVAAPRSCGLALGQMRQRWRTTGVFAAILIVPSIITMSFLQVPFYGASPALFVCVPLYEELLFRGFLLAVVAEVFPRNWSVRRVTVSTAALATGLAFGLWHLGGLRLPEQGFYWFQVTYTVIAGVLFAMLRERTGSIWPGWLIHTFVDAWAVNVPAVWNSGGA